jgi:hypothetical protein
MIGKGIYEEEINGETVGFKFGMYASAITEKIAGKSIFEVFKGIAAPMQEPLLHYFYGGAKAYNEHKKIDKEISVSDVADWLEEMGADKWSKIYLASIQSYIPKNGTAPVETGQEA